jgi:acyl-CoA thioester hydrolase
MPDAPPTAFHFTHRRQVEFADTDLAGIVHFANFFRYVETAEHAFFRSLGHAPHAAAASGSGHHGWPRLETSCRYHRPAHFEDTLEIGLRLLELRTTSLRYGFWIFSLDPAADPASRSKPSAGSLLVDGTFAIIHVALTPSPPFLQKTPIPAALRERLASFLPPISSLPPTG